MRIELVIIAAFCSFVALGARDASADTTLQPVIYSGHIAVTDQAAADGAYTMRFSALSASDSSAPLREIEVPVQVTAGAFAADVTPLVVDAADAAYMTVAVKGPNDADFDVLGDVRLSAVPYSVHADHAAIADSVASVDWSAVKNAPELLQGAVGPIGPIGPQGLQGVQGLTGPQGPQGPQGIAGVAGVSATVLEEEAGVNCSFGGLALLSADGAKYVCNGTSAAGTLVATSEPIGEHCATGGIAVNDGMQTRYICNGLQGLTGPAGAEGPQGLQGLTGATGPIGPQGLQGLTGATGPIGPQGIQGLTGATGSQGLTGPQGPIGLTGAQGPAGVIADSEQLMDSAGNVLGRVIGIDATGVKVYNNKGYIFTVGWDGKLRGADTYYTGLNCTGTAYMSSSGSTGTNYVKQLFRSSTSNSNLTLAAGGVDVNLSKLAQSLSIILSMEKADGTCVASLGVVLGWQTAAAGTSAETGVPASITAPLILPH